MALHWTWRCLFTSHCMVLLSRTCWTTVKCQLVTDVGRRHLRSSDVYTCVVPRTQPQIGDMSFSVVGPRLWSNIPTEIRRRGTTFGHHRRLLKAFLFVKAAAHCDFLLKCAGYKHFFSLTHSHGLPVCTTCCASSYQCVNVLFPEVHRP